MQAALREDFVSVEDYLAAEESSELRHEYLGGLVYAMAGETRDHNQIVQNIGFSLRQHLRGGRCKSYMSDIRVNFDIRDDAYYYYPDLVVTFDARDTHPKFVRHPKLLIEVLSPSTERIDRREKFFAYTTIESIEEYVLVGQDPREITVMRRAEDWRKEIISGADVVVALASIQITLPLAVIYEGV
jgi:Uma2 family endonuclease